MIHEITRLRNPFRAVSCVFVDRIGFSTACSDRTLAVETQLPAIYQLETRNLKPETSDCAHSLAQN